MGRMLEKGTFFTRDGTSSDGTSSDDNSSDDEERKLGSEKWDTDHKQAMDAKYLEQKVLRDKASARNGQEVVILTAHLRGQYHFTGMITGFNLDADTSTIELQVKLNQLQRHEGARNPVKIADNNTRESIPENELVSKAEYSASCAGSQT
jgi:hypothetical protein